MHKDSASRAQNQALLELCRGAACLNRISVFGKDSASRAQNQALLELCRGAACLNRISVFGKDSASRAQNQALLELCRGAACLNRISVFGKDGAEPGPFRFSPGLACPCRGIFPAKIMKTGKPDSSGFTGMRFIPCKIGSGGSKSNFAQLPLAYILLIPGVNINCLCPKNKSYRTKQID